VAETHQEITPMDHQLVATTPEGGHLIVLAEMLSADLAGRAAEHDRDGTYPHESIVSLRNTGYFAAPIPAEFGGLGVESVHDLVVASSRLSRGDASVAIGVNMHTIAVLNMAWRRRIAQATGNERRVAAFGAALEAIARDGVVMAAAISEREQDLLHPSTRATRTDDGWRVDGHKVFCTMSPAATHLYTAVSYTNGDGGDHYGYAQIPVTTPGVVVHDDWDALGMRASGSHSVSFEGVELPPAALRGGFNAGDEAGYLERNLTAGLFHASASLGIAEAADAEIAQALARRGGEPSAHTVALASGNVVDLNAARAVLARAASLIDEHRATHPGSPGTADELTALFAQAQAAKVFVGEACGRVVDRALALSGGAGYRSGSLLARAYRDVRAGAFMHPLGANRAHDYLGRLALGKRAALA
jgi:alkylation response protein AidB-like acyl-CoA dehydrogenase